MTYSFERVTRSRKVSFVCNCCAKSRSRVVRVTHTINPFNQNPDGSVRTSGEVLACVQSDLDALVVKTCVCATCERKSR
jgi:hypothetical protein